MKIKVESLGYHFVRRVEIFNCGNDTTNNSAILRDKRGIEGN